MKTKFWKNLCIPNPSNASNVLMLLYKISQISFFVFASIVYADLKCLSQYRKN